MGKTDLSNQELIAKGLRIAVVAARYNPKICEGLLKGALKELIRMGLREDEIAAFRVPGAFEIPYLAKKLALSKKFDAIVCLGVVIRGETSHFDYVCSGVTDGIMQAMLETATPMAFGILTTDNEAQALSRASDDAHNKGLEAARTAVEMVQLGRDF